jgi:ABC-type branched-subunit amino acid transport system substrate-binding protein
MKKLLLFVICVGLGIGSAFAEAESYKILYLIPFESDSYIAPAIKESDDMDNVRSYRLMGFWNGAQMAIEEYEKNGENIRFDIVVRDISNDERKLRRVMEDQELMSGVQLIIGPFFGKLFAVAAEYARQYQIPIVNPFTNRQDFIEGNEFVYKLIPSMEARPAMIAFLAQQSRAFPIIIYGDSTSKDKEMTAYLKYFRVNGIPYEITPNASTVVTRLDKNKPRIIITFYDNPAQNLIISRNLLYSEKTDNLTFVVPEKWMESKTYDIEYYNKLNLHFFSDYYIDFENEKTKTFVYDYTERFGVPPSLESFAFQGYDITRFFVELIRNDNDLDRVKVSPIAFPLSFDKAPGGGYENVNVQFLEVKDNEIVPSGF